MGVRETGEDFKREKEKTKQNQKRLGNGPFIHFLPAGDRKKNNGELQRAWTTVPIIHSFRAKKKKNRAFPKLAREGGKRIGDVARCEKGRKCVKKAGKAVAVGKPNEIDAPRSEIDQTVGRMGFLEEN